MAQSNWVYWIAFNKEAVYKSGQGMGSIIQYPGVETTGHCHPRYQRENQQRVLGKMFCSCRGGMELRDFLSSHQSPPPLPAPLPLCAIAEPSGKPLDVVRTCPFLGTQNQVEEGGGWTWRGKWELLPGRRKKRACGSLVVSQKWPLGLKDKVLQKILQTAQNLLILDFLHLVTQSPLDHGLFPNYIFRKCKITFILALLNHH